MSLRPTDPKRITTSDLLPGDILMSVGPASNALDTLITTIDQGDYSHASLYAGREGDTHMVVEATQGGIKYEPIKVDLDAQVLVDAYRFVSRDGHHLGDPGWPAQPILDAAMKYVGAGYSYSELFLAAVALLSANKSSNSDYVNMCIHWFEIQVGMRLEDWINQQMGVSNQMTCVQVAVAAYWQASPDDGRYAIWVNMLRPVPPAAAKVTAASTATTRSPAELGATRGRLRHALEHGLGQRATPAAATTAAGPEPTELPGGSAMLPAGFCSPRDLETSSSLTFVGCLQDTR